MVGSVQRFYLDAPAFVGGRILPRQVAGQGIHGRVRLREVLIAHLDTRSEQAKNAR